MAKVLVVDDEHRYRELIGRILAADGHQSATASSGREALDVGTRYRPDVLVTDWMLKDDIHGLHVINALHAVLPDLRTIMMTGFPAADLRSGADKAGVHAFLEKPFDAQCVQTAVRDVVRLKDQAPSLFTLGMIELDSAGSIVFANPAAQALMDDTSPGRSARNLSALFADDVESTLGAAMDRWVAVLPRSGGHKRWHVRAQEPLDDGSRLIIVRRWDEPHYHGLALVEMLLNVREVEHTRWPFDGRVLVIDDEAMHRALCVSMLEGVGAGCYAAASSEEALRLLEQDRELLFVLLDLEMPGADLRLLVEQIKALRPDVTLVGNSGGLHQREFAAMGLDHCLTKPWRVDDLINVLTGRIGNCVSCGLPVPLRRPKPGEEAGSWECCGCGARYGAVLDPDCPKATLANVRPGKRN
jgi:CheY-like chemotaxis protein